MARYLSVPQWLRWTLSYPMLALDTQLPNGYVGRQDSQLTLRAIACGFLQDGHYGVPTVCIPSGIGEFTSRGRITIRSSKPSFLPTNVFKD